MAFELAPLPYAYDSLAPYTSVETLEFHHDKHHATYVNNLNNVIKGTEFEGKTLEDVISFFPDSAETVRMAKERLEKMKSEGR